MTKTHMPMSLYLLLRQISEIQDQDLMQKSSNEIDEKSEAFKRVTEEDQIEGTGYESCNNLNTWNICWTTGRILKTYFCKSFGMPRLFRILVIRVTHVRCRGDVEERTHILRIDDPFIIGYVSARCSNWIFLFSMMSQETGAECFICNEDVNGCYTSNIFSSSLRS